MSIVLAGAMLVACLLPTMAEAGWTGPAPVTGTSPDAGDTRIAGNPDSTPLVVWTKPVLGISTVQAARLNADGTTGPVLTLSSPGQVAELPVVAMSSNGTAVVAWLWTDGANDVVQSVTIDPANDVSVVGDRSAVGPAGQDAAAPRVAIQNDRTSAIAWRKYNGSKYIVQGRVVNSTGAALDIRDLEALNGQNTDFPDIAAISDGTFRLIWAEGTGPLGNVGTQLLNADGTLPALPVTYMFPTTALVNGVEAPAGVTGEPAGAKIVGFTDGTSSFGWLRDIPTDPAVPTSAVRSVEGSGFGALSINPAVRISPTTHDVSQFSLSKSATQMGTDESGASALLGGNSAVGAWTTENPGDRRVEIRRMTPSGGLGSTVSVSGNVGTEGFPVAALSLQSWSTVTWFESTATPGITAAKAKTVSPTGLSPGATQNFTSGSLKSTGNPGVMLGPDSIPTVVFDAVDTGNLMSSQFSRFSDPGMPTVSPPSLAFGSQLVNLKTKSRSAYLVSTGSTTNNIQGISIAGPDASQFVLSGGSDCKSGIAPGYLCSIGVNFKPTTKGSHKAELKVQTSGDPVKVPITGKGVARTRVSLKVKPKNIAVRKGKTKKVTAIVNNTGGLQAKGVRVCAYGNKKVIRPKKRCRKIGSIAVGQTVKRKFSLRLKGKAKKGKKYAINFQMKSNNANSRRATSRFKARN